MEQPGGLQPAQPHPPGMVEAQTELATRLRQLDMQYRELESQRAALTQLAARHDELAQALAAERQVSAHWKSRAERLEAHLRNVVSETHHATLDATVQIQDATRRHQDAVARGDKLTEQAAMYEAAIQQLRTTIEQQRADREQLMQERQAAHARCTDLESQLHQLRYDADHAATPDHAGPLAPYRTG